MWLVVENGHYQHVFTKLDSPYKMMGQLVSWASICGRSFAINEPQPNAKKKKCVYCQELSGQGEWTSWRLT